MKYLLSFIALQVVFGFWLAHSIEKGQMEVGQDDDFVDYLLPHLVLGAFGVIDLIWLCGILLAPLFSQSFSWYSYGG